MLAVVIAAAAVVTILLQCNKEVSAYWYTFVTKRDVRYKIIIPIAALIIVIPIIAPASASDSIVIDEIMFNPMVDDSGREWIEIHNNGTETQNTNGWTISNRTGAVAATLPNWDFSGGTYLVVHFGSGTDDNNFTDGNGHFYTNDSIAVFNTAEDECVLCNAAPSTPSIIDFVSWCSDGPYFAGIAHGYAVSAGRGGMIC
jgi:hypothetical protein